MSLIYSKMDELFFCMNVPGIKGLGCLCLSCIIKYKFNMNAYMHDWYWVCEDLSCQMDGCFPGMGYVV